MELPEPEDARRRIGNLINAMQGCMEAGKFPELMHAITCAPIHHFHMGYGATVGELAVASCLAIAQNKDFMESLVK